MSSATKDRITRRAALKAALSLSTVSLASRLGLPALAQAASQAASGRRFVFCYFQGGWDQLLFLDPRDPSADGGRYSDANRASTLTEPGYASLQGSLFAPTVVRAGDLTFGPAVESRTQRAPKLTKHADRIAIVRGMNMGTLGHEVGTKYFNTCRFPNGSMARGSSVATECAALSGGSAPIPVISLQIDAYNDAYPAAYSAMRVDSVDDLLVVLERGKDLLEKDPVEEALAEFGRRPQSAAVSIYDRTGLVTRMRDADSGTKAILGTKLADRFRFATSDDPDSAALRAKYGLAKGDAKSGAAHAAFVSLALKQGVAQCVSITLGGALDTHFSGNLTHAQSLHPAVEALSMLIDDLATSDAPAELQKLGGRTWLDHTTILAFSEFARTPMFNVSGGRDHHLCSSCLLAGAGIAGGRVAGASGAVGMGPCRYDFVKGAVVPEGGDAITPETVRATLLASAGLPTEAAGLHAQPLRALLAGAR